MELRIEGNRDKAVVRLAAEVAAGRKYVTEILRPFNAGGREVVDEPWVFPSSCHG